MLTSLLLLSLLFASSISPSRELISSNNSSGSSINKGDSAGGSVPPLGLEVMNCLRGVGSDLFFSGRVEFSPNEAGGREKALSGGRCRRLSWDIKDRGVGGTGIDDDVDEVRIEMEDVEGFANLRLGREGFILGPIGAFP